MAAYNCPMNGVFWGVGDADHNAEDEIHVCLGMCPAELTLLNVSDPGYHEVYWQRTLGCLSSNIMEGIVLTGTSSVTRDDLAENTGIACYAGGDTLRFNSTLDRWEYETATPGTWADATEKFLDECGNCIFPKRNPTPEGGLKQLTPPGFRVGYDSDVLNQDGEEIHYVAHFGRFCNCDTDADGTDDISGGTYRSPQ